MSPLTLLAIMTGTSLRAALEARRCGKAGPAGHRPRLSLDCGKKDSKVRVLSRKTSFCPRLLEQGFAGHHLAIAVGVRLGPKDAQAKREKEARVRLQRIDFLPSSIPNWLPV